MRLDDVERRGRIIGAVSVMVDMEPPECVSNVSSIERLYEF